MDTQVQVSIDLESQILPVGRLWGRMRQGRDSASFEYGTEWLEQKARFPLEPALMLGPGPFHTEPGKPLFGAFGDSAPDRWGRALMRRAERRRADAAGEAPRTLREIDFLLGVNDEARQGALRYSLEPGGPYLASADVTPIPPLVDLPRLLSAAEHVVGDCDSDEDLRVLLGPGSSLGGARPKASVRDRDGQLAIAKFPHQGDEVDSVRWEGVALFLAEKAGIVIPRWRIETVGTQRVLILGRFDRQGHQRRPFLSAMSLLGAKDNDTRSYLEIVDALRQHGSQSRADMHALWRRVVFNILISNTDDHLRNHGFLSDGSVGWRLSPAYDMNPVPTDIKPRVHAMSIDLDDSRASVETALSVAGYFELGPDDAQRILGEVGTVTSRWREAATQLGIRSTEVQRMVSAFEHDDLETALS